MPKCNRCDEEMEIQGRSIACPQCGTRLILFDEETRRFNFARQEEERARESRGSYDDARLIVEGDAIERSGLNVYGEDWDQFVERTAPDSMLQRGYCEKCQEEFSTHYHNIISVCPCPRCGEPMVVNIVEDCPVVLEIVENEI